MIVNCHQCGAEFSKPTCWVKRSRTRRHFCTKRCHDATQRASLVLKDCAECGTAMAISPSMARRFTTCGAKKCLSLRRSKERNPNWRGGITEPRKAAMSTGRYKRWRKAVFERDDYTCQGPRCGKRGGPLEGDHIKPWAKFPRLRYKVSNGRTLCRPCHKKTFAGQSQRPHQLKLMMEAA